MPEYFSKNSLKLLYSTAEQQLSEPLDQWVQVPRSTYHTYSAIPLKYRKLGAGGVTIEEMTAGEKAAADASELNDARDEAVVAEVDAVESVLRAFMLVVLDELNAQAAQMNTITAAVDGASNMSQFQSNMQAISDYPNRTAAQLRASIRAKLGI